MPELSFDILQRAVGGPAAAFRTYIRLQPAGGPGSKVFPPTYSGGVYAMEHRRINEKKMIDGKEVLVGTEVPAVLLDSVQSQANRLEEALRNAWEEERLRMPMIYTDFSAVPLESATEEVRRSVREVGRITTLDAPHRIADAIMRDSVTADGRAFRDAYARAFEANLRNATALFELCPAALVFGTWDSTGSRGGLGNKFARSLVSEIVGINAVAGVRTSSRIDPLAISSKVPIYARNVGGWTALEAEARHDDKSELVKYSSKGGKGNPSAVNHSNVTPDHARYSSDDISDKNRKTPDPLRPGKDIEVGAFKAGGVTIDYALQIAVLSLPALRRLRFPSANGPNAERNHAARTVLAALGLVAIAEQFQQGAFLRSRCDLVPETPDLTVECVRSATVTDDDRYSLSPQIAIQLLDQAVEAAAHCDLPWPTQPIPLVPSADLVGLVAESRRLELSGQAESEG